MPPGNEAPMARPLQTQRGAALLVLLTLIVLASSYTLLQRVNQTTSPVLRAADDAAVLGQAKAALVGFALSSTTRPGELPCPDTDNDGRADAPCPGAIGRLPWFDLGIADLRDHSGERLWYRVTDELSLAGKINSDTTASLTVDTAPNFAAVIFAPGPAMNGQSRAASNNVANYLEDGNSDGNADFVTTPTNPNNDFNDQLIAIERSALLLKVEKRVLGEIRNTLQTYYDSNGFFYPYPAPWGSDDCDSSADQGWIPINVTGTCPGQPDWGGLAPLPGWFEANDWNEYLWYAPAPACTQGNPNCSGPVTDFITVQNLPAPNDDKRAILIAPGPDALPGQSRAPAGGITDLLDDPGNNNEADLTFVHLPLDNSNNDQIMVVAP